MAAKKKVDPIKAREKKMKMIAIGGFVLLVIVAVIEVPSVMKMMKGPPPPQPVAVAPAVSGGVLPDLAGGAPTVTPSGQLVDTDVPPASASEGQLVSFDVFEAKNPFAPQGAGASSSSSSSSSTPSPSAGAAAAPATTTTASTPPTTPAAAAPPAATSTTPASVVPPASATPTTPATTTFTPSTSTTPTTPTRPTATISVNGVVSKVASAGTFPTKHPVFRLVSLGSGSVRIGIVGGSLATGDATLELSVGKAVTLANSTDGSRYKLLLVSAP